MAQASADTQGGPFGFHIARVGNGVTDLALAAACYEALGFKASPPYDLGTTIAGQSETPGVPLTIQIMRKDWLALELCQAGTPRPPGPPQRRPMNLLGLTHLAFSVDDVDRVLDVIVRHGGTRFDFAMDKASNTGLGADLAFCADPCGTRLLLMGRTPDRSDFALPGSSAGADGIAVAHLGVCVADLERSLDFYEALGFRRGPVESLGTAFSRLAELDGVELRTATIEHDGYVLWLQEWGGRRDPGVPVRLPLNRSGQLIHFGTHCDDFTGMLELVRSSGGSIVERTRGVFPPPGLSAPGMTEANGWVFILDPNGVQIEIVGPES